MADQKQSQNPPETPPNEDHNDYQICTRCHRRISLNGFTRSAAESDSDNFNLKLMTTCNYCALLQRNQRALGKYKDKDVPKTEKKTHVLTEAQYLNTYGGAVIQGELVEKAKRVKKPRRAKKQAVRNSCKDPGKGDQGGRKDDGDDDNDNDNDGGDDKGGRRDGAQGLAVTSQGHIVTV
ncbi:hypothetical protein Daus18300_005507 [Diaporthe australafricana]|uniref:Stc1 domain-containing protein n=1 Tax=Diaporthe australafricana TaxID=127596 RepID=A0ABR3X1T8_9PEZI